MNDGTDFYIQKPEKIKVGLYHRDLCGGGFSSRCSHAAREEGNGTGKPYNAKGVRLELEIEDIQMGENWVPVRCARMEGMIRM